LNPPTDNHPRGNAYLAVAETGGPTGVELGRLQLAVVVLVGTLEVEALKSRYVVTADVAAVFYIELAEGYRRPFVRAGAPA